MKTADTDGSGGLDADELDAGMKSLMRAPSSTVDFAQRREASPPPDDGVASAGDTSSASTKSLEDLFKVVDSNGDGSLDAGEIDTLKSKLDTALQSLEGGSGASSTAAADATGGSSASGSAQAPWLALTRLVLQEYASAASPTSDRTAAISTRA